MEPLSVFKVNLNNFENIPFEKKRIVIDDFYGKLVPGIIPNTVEVLMIYDSFFEPLLEGVVPKSVKELRLILLKHELNIGIIPSSVNNLCIASFYPIKPGLIPSSVSELYLSIGSDDDIIILNKNVIPDSVKCLYLSFAGKFNSYSVNIVNGSIPSSVLTLDLFWSSKNSIPINAIPNSVTHLILRYESNSPIKLGTIPKSVSKFEIYTKSCFSFKMEDCPMCEAKIKYLY